MIWIWILVQLSTIWVLVYSRIPFEDELTASGFAVRCILLLVLLACYLSLGITLWKRVQRKQRRKLAAVLLTAVLLVESAILLPFFVPKQNVSLEYVCSVERTSDKPLALYTTRQDAIWFTNCSQYSPVEPKENIEQGLCCDLSGFELDDHYTYLFVYDYQDVSLSYHPWKYGEDNLIPTLNYYWYGDLEVYGEAEPGKIFIFRFPRKRILPHDLQWL